MAKLLTIHPPLAGIVRGRGFQQTPPYSCRESVNFWPQFAFDGSEQLAIRPPMEAFDTPGVGVNLLARVNGTNADTPQRTIVAGCDGVLYRWDGSAFIAVGGVGTLPTGRAAFAQAFEQKVYIPGTTPLVYDYPSDTLAAWTASAGTVPVDTRIIVYWAGGLWTGGAPDEPHIFSGCRTGAPLDWNFNATDEGAAFSTIGDNAGLISDPVTAAMPIDGDSMIISGPDSMQIWRGHPRRGGVADLLSSSVGVRGQGAWTQGSDGTIYAVTNKGFVAIQNGQTISAISEDRIPSELIGFDYDYLDPRISCAFDAKFNCVYITIRDDDNPQAWYYDLKNGGLFQMELTAYPHVMHRFDPIGTGRASEVLFGGAGYGGLARFDLDGTESIDNARIVLGPMKLTSSPLTRAKIKEANFVFGGGTDAVDATVGLYCGPTLDSSYASATSGEGAAKHVTSIDRIMASQGRIRPLAAGHGLSIVIDHSTAQDNPKIVFDEATLLLEDAGRERGHVMHSDTTGPRAGSFQSPHINLLTNIFAAYKMEEASGTRQDAHTGNHDLLVDAEPVGSTTGKISNGARFNSAVDLTSLRGDFTEAYNPTLGITLAAWIRHDASGLNPGFSMSIDNDDACSFALAYQPDNDRFQITMEDAGGQDVLQVDASNLGVDMTDGEYHLLMGIYNPATSTIQIFADNIASSTVAATLTWVDTGVVSFGMSANVDDDFGVDEVGVWNTALNAALRSRYYNSGAGRTYPFT